VTDLQKKFLGVKEPQGFHPYLHLLWPMMVRLQAGLQPSCLSTCWRNRALN